MSDTEQELACLHADATAALFRVELKIGVAEQLAKALSQQGVMADRLARRDAQSAVFGTRTMKERRIDDDRLGQLASVPSNPPLKEREMLAGVGRNPYEKALLLAAMAPFQAEAHRRGACLAEAAECLVRAQAAEDGLFAQAGADARPRQAAPLPPRITQRTPGSVTLVHQPLNLKGNKRPVKYCVFAKPYGSGVALTINKSAMEHPGTGVQVCAGGARGDSVLDDGRSGT
eukprot:265900-Chlamydomonas_euryale.AAC.1